MTPLYIASQVLVFIGIAVDLVGRIMKNKKLVLIFTVVASAFYVSSYICLAAPLPAIINGVNVVRNFVYVFLNEKDKPFKSYIIPMILAILSTVPFVAIFWTSPMDLFMIASITVLTIGLAFKNMLSVRLSLILNSALWCVYNFSLKGYANMTCDIINMSISVVAIILYNVIPYIKQKKAAQNAPLAENIEPQGEQK